MVLQGTSTAVDNVAGENYIGAQLRASTYGVDRAGDEHTSYSLEPFVPFAVGLARCGAEQGHNHDKRDRASAYRSQRLDTLRTCLDLRLISAQQRSTQTTNVGFILRFTIHARG